MVGNTRTSLKRSAAYVVLALLLSLGTSGLAVSSVWAAPLASRSLNIEQVTAGSTTRHTFTFSYGSTTDPVGSVVFEYCTSPLPELPCTTPAGLDASGAALTQQTGETGYTMLSAQPGKLTLARPAAQPPTNNPSQYVFDTIVNPSSLGAFYVRVTTYASADGSGPYIDFGAVVNSVNQGVQISSEVPPILKFCVGISLGDDCSAADESVVDLGDMSTSRAASGSSQMVAGTNAEFGLAIAVYGTTLTSGNNTIAALDAPTRSAPGNAQFGINLRANSDPAIGREPSGIGVATPTSTYNIPNRYVFTSGSVIATSNAATDTRKFTASYVANVSPSQPPGVYTATLTYICTATF